MQSAVVKLLLQQRELVGDAIGDMTLDACMKPGALLTCNATSTLREVLHALIDAHVHGMPIVDGPSGRLVCVFV